MARGELRNEKSRPPWFGFAWPSANWLASLIGGARREWTTEETQATEKTKSRRRASRQHPPRPVHRVFCLHSTSKSANCTGSRPWNSIYISFHLAQSHIRFGVKTKFSASPWDRDLLRIQCAKSTLSIVCYSSGGALHFTFTLTVLVGPLAKYQSPRLAWLETGSAAHPPPIRSPRSCFSAG